MPAERRADIDCGLLSWLPLLLLLLGLLYPCAKLVWLWLLVVLVLVLSLVLLLLAPFDYCVKKEGASNRVSEKERELGTRHKGNSPDW